MSSAPATRASFYYERYRTRLTGALIFSLLLHALILSLQFGIPGVGLPTLEMPWRERRAQAIDVHIVSGNAARPSETKSEESPASPPAEPARADGTGLKLYSAPLPPRTAAPEKRKPRRTKAEPPPAARKPISTLSDPVIALSERRPDSFVVPPSYSEEVPSAETPPEPVAERRETVPPPVTEPQAETDNLRREIEAKQREDLAQRDALAAQARAEAERLALEQEARRREETLRKEQAMAEQQALELERRRQAEEAAQRQAALALQRQQEETQRLAQEEAARRVAELEAKRREEAQRIEREATELQARKQAEEAERQRQAALERQRQAEELAARQKADAEAAARRREAELAAAEKARADAALPRDITGGSLASRALDQARRSEIFRNDGPTTSRPVESNPPSERRGSILGRVAQDVGLMMYVESWRLKIERNGNLNFRQSSVEKARGDPVVTVAVRSDGSVENVIIHRTSGRPELDDAVRRIVRLNERYGAFPPELARRFDVIEIRRIWSFDERLRILEEVR